MAASKNPGVPSLLKVVNEEIYKCIRCGECRTVCPVFRETPSERYTARGKMQIAEGLAKGTLEFNDRVREALDNCLLCTGCANQCSSGARADRVIIATRQAFAKELGIPPVKKAIAMALTQPSKLLGVEARIGSMLQPLLFKAVPQTSGLYRRFAMPVVDENQYIPEIASVPFRDRVQFAGKSGQKKVTFFTGCMTNYAMTEIGDSLVKVLNALDIAVDVPSEQGCCGMPMLASGDVVSVRKQAARNVKALANLSSDEPIVVACASCGHMLKHGYHDMLADDAELAPLLENIASRTMDITEYLIRIVGEEKVRALVGSGAPASVTYHDPCHLRKAQKIVAEPRKVLGIAARSDIKEMEHPEICCGLGGTYCIANMERSKQIQSRKIDEATDTGANCIATACPGCILQLRDGVRRGARPAMDVKHVIQLLAEAIR